MFQKRQAALAMNHVIVTNPFRVLLYITIFILQTDWRGATLNDDFDYKTTIQ